MADSMVDALLAGSRAFRHAPAEEVSKHDGPGPHEGTGTDQSVHSGDAAMSQFGGMVEQVKVSDLFGFREFTRDKLSERYQRVKESIAREGIKEPIILDWNPETGKAFVSEGNHRLLAAKELGRETVPVVVFRSNFDRGNYVPGSLDRVKPNEHGYVPGRMKPSDLLPDWVSKHEGPGPHPGTGSPQDVHSGGQPGTESGAIDTPWGLDAFSPKVQERILDTVEKRMREENVDLEEKTLIGHLTGLWDRARKEDPEGFERSRLWYPAAKEYGTAVGEAFDTDSERAVGILAALSPQTGWGRNQDMAADLMGLLWEDPVVRGTDITAPARLSELSPGMVARFLSGLTHPSLKVTEGQRKGEAKMLFDQSAENIEKAVMLHRGESPDTVLGNGPKVRSFFNNLLLPDRKTSWTDDTHMRRVWLQDPDISNGSKRFRRIFGSAPTIKGEYDRSWGTYPYYATVGGKAADKLGVLPQEVQAVTWTQWRKETGVDDRDERRGLSDLDQVIEQLGEELVGW